MATGTVRTDPAAMHRRILRARRASVLLPIVTLIATGRAGTLTYGVDAGVGETDNVTLTHFDKVSQTIAVTDIDLDYKQKSQWLNMDAKGDFSYLKYLQNAYGNQLLGRFDGNAEIALIPQRLTWVVMDDFGQSAIDPFTPTVPNNLENINVFSTGPDLYLRLGGAAFANFSARVARAQYETTPNTNTRASGSAAWGLNLSALSSASFNVDTERVFFQNTQLNTDFDRTNVFARYALQGGRTELSGDLGATSVGESGGSTAGGLARFKLARKLSASARLTATLGHEIVDGVTSFSTLQAGASGVVGTAPATNTSENYTSNYGSVDWDYVRNRTSLGLSARWEKDGYFSLPSLDRTITTVELRLQRQLTRSFALQVTGRLYKTDYGNVTVTDANGSPNNTTGSAAAALTWRHGRALEVKMACEHTTYTTSPNDTGYRENRIFLTLGYRPFKEASPIGEEVPGI